MKGNKYPKILAKIQVSDIFHIGEILGEITRSNLLQSFVWRPREDKGDREGIPHTHRIP